MMKFLVLILFLFSCGSETGSGGKLEGQTQPDVGIDQDIASTDAADIDMSDATSGGMACGKLLINEVDFGMVTLGESSTQTIQIENCSATESLTLTASSTGPITVGVPNSLSPGQNRDIELVYSPTVVGPFSGQVPIQTSAGALTVSAVGEGIAPELCPIAVISVASPAGSPLPLEVPGGTLVSLTGRTSVAKQGTVDSYSWSIVSQPEGVMTTFDRPNTSAEVDLFLEVSGTYVIELSVTDSLNMPACVPTRLGITVTSTSSPKIRAILTWDTPADMDQTDMSGTDLDLHYLHPSGRWNRAPFDIFWRNPTADWGSPSQMDDPKLIAFDDDGLGPEIVEHGNPEAQKTYSLAVYYYEDRGFGVSHATVKLYIDGLLSYKSAPKALTNTQFWRVLTIDTSADSPPIISAIDSITNGFP